MSMLQCLTQNINATLEAEPKQYVENPLMSESEYPASFSSYIYRVSTLLPFLSLVDFRTYLLACLF